MTPSIPKLPNRRTRKKAEETAKREARQHCREVVMLRDEYRCRVCRVWLGHIGHTHEVKFRSLGGDATDPTNCVYLCAAHHAEVHAHTLTLSWEGEDLLLSRPNQLFQRL